MQLFICFDPAEAPFQAVVELLAEETWNMDDRDFGPAEVRERMASDIAIFASAGGELVAFARADWEVQDGARFLKLRDVVVAKHARGRGVGSRIVEKLMEAAPDAEWRLHTDDAFGFYERFGFVRVGDTKEMRREP